MVVGWFTFLFFIIAISQGLIFFFFLRIIVCSFVVTGKFRLIQSVSWKVFLLSIHSEPGNCSLCREHSAEQEERPVLKELTFWGKDG